MSTASKDIWAVFGSLPDVRVYFEIFNDYLDFDIRPWDKNGYDQGKMLIERKTALRFLKMGINMYNSGNLTENILNEIQQYIPEKDQIPEEYRIKRKKPSKKNLEKQIEQAVTGKVLERFGHLKDRKGFRVSDMVETKQTQQIGKDRYIDTTTRSVFWDVPGEDSVSPLTWDWKRYSTDGELANYEKDMKADKRRRREEKKKLR